MRLLEGLVLAGYALAMLAIGSFIGLAIATVVSGDATHPHKRRAVATVSQLQEAR